MHHATPFLLSALDRVQEGFLEALDLDEEDAFTDHNLAPLRLRRDIAMLGFLRRFAHGKSPSAWRRLLDLARQPPCLVVGNRLAMAFKFSTRLMARSLELSSDQCTA